MTGFRGSVALKIDPKGRLLFPQMHKATLQRSKQIIITNSSYKNEPCLDVYTLKEWENLEKKIAKLPSFDENVQAFQRFYMASAVACDLDSQGRFLVPQLFRDYAELSGDVTFVGMGHKLEVWSAEKWTKIFGTLKKSFEEIQRSLSLIEREKK